MRAYLYDFGVGKDFFRQNTQGNTQKKRKIALDWLKLRLDIKETLLSENQALY